MEGANAMTGTVGKVKEPKNIVVIGAGIGGMCAAARLARAGHKVSIYEASDRVGGKCRTEWIGRYGFDTGPSLLTIPAVFRDFFQRTGQQMGQVLELTSVDPSFDYRFADSTSVKFTNLSRKSTLESIRSTYGEEAAQQWDRALIRAEAMWVLPANLSLSPNSVLHCHCSSDGTYSANSASSPQELLFATFHYLILIFQK
jgi:phytoene dehydrogenase-like protein